MLLTCPEPLDHLELAEAASKIREILGDELADAIESGEYDRKTTRDLNVRAATRACSISRHRYLALVEQAREALAEWA